MLCQGLLIPATDHQSKPWPDSRLKQVSTCSCSVNKAFAVWSNVNCLCRTVRARVRHRHQTSWVEGSPGWGLSRATLASGKVAAKLSEASSDVTGQVFPKQASDHTCTKTHCGSTSLQGNDKSFNTACFTKGCNLVVSAVDDILSVLVTALARSKQQKRAGSRKLHSESLQRINGTHFQWRCSMPAERFMASNGLPTRVWLESYGLKPSSREEINDKPVLSDDTVLRPRMQLSMR